MCLGVLGDHMILETGRFNKAGEIYVTAYSLLTLNEAGKIVGLEAFSDVQAASLVMLIMLLELIIERSDGKKGKK
jgi:hypothetical protein